MANGEIIAITGRSGSGKSTVARYYASLGYPVLDGDQVSRDITKPGTACLVQLAQHFGADIVDENGNLRRRELAQRAFVNQETTQQLMDITHPAIVQTLLEQARQQQNAPFVFVDGAAIVGAAFEPYCSKIIVVIAPKESAVSHIMQRDQISQEVALQRLAAQTPEDILLAAADYVIENNQSQQVLLVQADAVLKALLVKEKYGEELSQ